MKQQEILGKFSTILFQRISELSAYLYKRTNINALTKIKELIFSFGLELMNFIIYIKVTKKVIVYSQGSNIRVLFFAVLFYSSKKY